MYRHSTEVFGNFQKHILQNTVNGDEFTLVPECGALLLSCKLDGIELIDGYKSPDELEKLEYGKSLFLFPFPNRLDGGKFTYDGVSYQFPANDPSTGNAIHGFGYKTPFTVNEVNCTGEHAAITCSYNYDGRNTAFPFPFRCSISFLLTDKQLEVSLSITNTGEGKMPIGLGWHPYFKLSAEVNDLQLQMPELDLIEVDDRMLPTGNRIKYSSFTSSSLIGNTRLDNCFFINMTENPFEVVLKSDIGLLTYSHETGRDKFNYIQVFTPDHRRSIALEPMTCNINALNNGEGLKILEPGSQFGGSCRIRFVKKMHQNEAVLKIST